MSVVRTGGGTHMAEQASGNNGTSGAPGPNNGAGSTRPAGEDSPGIWARVWKRLKSSVFQGIIPGIISGLLVSFFITSTGHSAGIRILEFVHFQKTPNCNDPGWLLQVPDDQILANSYYATADTLRYHGTLHTADLTVDGNVRTAWLQWWPTDSFGHTSYRRNYITWSLSRRYDVRLVCILNGWTETSHTFDDVEPVKTGSIGVIDKECNQTPVLLKTRTYTYDWNPVRMTFGPTKFLCMQILSTYPAFSPDCVPGPLRHERPCRPMTGLSEVRFYYSPAVLNWASF
jgi:hypothetical protein